MRETKFIEQNQEKWAEYEAMMREKQRDPERLNELFIQITDDLSYARTFYPNRSVRVYLNHIAQRIFHHIYKGRRLKIEQFGRFWTHDLPQVMWESRKALRLSFFIFVLAFGIGVLSSVINPEFARVVLGDQYVEMTIDNINSGDPMAVYKDKGALGMTAGIAANNLWVAFRTAILGVLASLGTVFIMLYNGIMVGAFQYFFIERGLFWESFLTIWIHGTPEIGAIIIAGAAGLTAGSGLLFPGTFTRLQAFQITMRRGLKIFIGIAPVIILAAIFEGFLTRLTETPAILRATFIMASAIFMVGYFVWLPWAKARRGHFDRGLSDRELPPDRNLAVDFKAIKSGGEIISDVFLILSQHIKQALMGVFGASAVFTLFALATAEGPVVEAFDYHATLFMGTYDGSRAFFPYSWRVMMPVGLMWLLTLGAFSAVERHLPEDWRAPFAANRIFGALGFLLPIGLTAFFYQLETGGLFLLFGVGLTMVFAVWMAAIYFEQTNLFNALGRLFSFHRYFAGLVPVLVVYTLTWLLFYFFDSSFWTMLLQFFSWLSPPGEGNVRAYAMIVTTFVSASTVFFSWLLLVVAGALQYFSDREKTEAMNLRSAIAHVGESKQIRGLAKEG